MVINKSFYFSIFFILFLGSFSAALIDDLFNGTESSGIIEKTGHISVDNILDLSSPKIDSYLKQEAEKFIGEDILLIVHTSGKISSSEKQRLLEKGASIKYEYTIIDAVALSLDTAELGPLAELGFVKKIELDAPAKAVLAQSTTQIGASRVWLQYGAEGKGVKISVLDTGIDNDHQDLQNVVLEQDFTGEGTDDDNGHGTHVASIVAGSGKLSGGTNKGVASKASLIDVKVLDGFGKGFMSDVIAGIQYSVVNDADIISMSLGSEIPCNGLDATSLAVDAAVKQGVHVVVAAGNTGPLPGTIGSPGCSREAVTVGAVDRLDNVAVFSSRGPTLDGRTKPDIVAPGVLILAAQSGGAYTAKSGTSMATPHVSGVTALILSENPELTPEQIKNILKDTAFDIGEDFNSQGAGRVQAYESFVKGTGIKPEDYPQEDDEQKEEAKRKAREEENVENIEKVREKEENGNDYYVIDGTRKDNEGNNERVWVWYNRDTKDIEKIEVIGFFEKLWLFIIDLFSNLLLF